MADSGQNTESINLQPGEIYFSESPAVITTILGSCLGITMFSRQRKKGAIAHPMLPKCPSMDRCTADCAEKGKYVDCSIKELFAAMATEATLKKDVEIKIFGGSDMFQNSVDREKALTVGRQNIRAAETILSSSGINILASDTGGSSGRKILFFSHTGEVYLKRLVRQDTPEMKENPH